MTIDKVHDLQLELFEENRDERCPTGKGWAAVCYENKKPESRAMKDFIYTESRENLNPYYTRAEIGDLLSSVLDIPAPKAVLDLGAGEGSLSGAVSDRWPHAIYTTVDVVQDTGTYLLRMFNHKKVKHHHYHWDVLTKNLPSGLEAAGFDLAVCNPPFFRPNISPDHLEILSLGGLRSACPNPTDNRAEILFLAQNLRLVRPGGTIALIMPDSLLTGDRFRAFRSSVLKKYNVTCVMQLPRHSFHNTEARCFVLVLRKEPPKKDAIRLLRYQQGTDLPPIWITATQAVNRMDYDFHASHVDTTTDGFRLRDLKAEVRRGTFSTTQRKSLSENIFHTTDFKSLKNGEVAFPPSFPPLKEGAVIAEPGDILMARVDRSLHLKVALVTKGRAAITDCVYRIRLPQEHQKRAFKALRAPQGEQALLSATKGVSARLLGKEALLSLILKEPLSS